MKVYPGSSGDPDMGHTSVGYRGAAQSSISHDEMESQRNRMTLEEARWVGVRKKVPGMSGIPSKNRSKSGGLMNMPYEDPYQKVDMLRFFVSFQKATYQLILYRN